MKHVIIGTDRLGSNSKKIAELVRDRYQKNHGETVEILDLADIVKGLQSGPQYGAVSDPVLLSAMNKVESSDGLVLVVPEYNGSMPGVLKYFIDHLKYPDAFESRPVCFIGLGGMFGGLRPVEHLQQVFGYRNAFIFPERIFVMNVFQLFKKTAENPEGELKDQAIIKLIEKQISGFRKFVDALKSCELHALTRSK
jgi:chromate reductase